MNLIKEFILKPFVYQSSSLFLSSGRQFYKCSNNPNKCDFFLWADDETMATNQGGGGGGRGPGGGGGFHGNIRQQGGQIGGQVMCQCNQLAPM